LKQDGKNEIALNDLGIAYDLQRRYSDAQAAYRKAPAIDPTMAAARTNLARSERAMGSARAAEGKRNSRLQMAYNTGPGNRA
jgi:Flp pilus assembly protein TadD